MNRREGVSALHGYQYFALTALFCLGGILLLGQIELRLGGASWIAVAAGFVGLIFAVPAVRAAQKNGGVPRSRALAAVLAVYYALSALLLLWLASSFAGGAAGIPAAVFLPVAALAALYGARGGGRTLGRVAVLTGAVTLVFLIAALCAEALNADIGNIFPVAISDEAALPLMSLYAALFFFCEPLAAVSLLPAAAKRPLRLTLLSLLAGNGLLLALSLISCLALGDLLTLENGLTGFFRAGRAVSPGEYIDRIELMPATAAFMATLFRCSLELCFARSCLCRCLPQARRASQTNSP